MAPCVFRYRMNLFKCKCQEYSTKASSIPYAVWQIRQKKGEQVSVSERKRNRERTTEYFSAMNIMKFTFGSLGSELRVQLCNKKRSFAEKLLGLFFPHFVCRGRAAASALVVVILLLLLCYTIECALVCSVYFLLSLLIVHVTRSFSLLFAYCFDVAFEH